ncbi:MAG TPA: DUF72 domain-containing protein [Ktedonobacteraceae bacterium]
MFYIGCPMWGYKEWVGNFFPARTPAGDFLRLYSRRMTTVEGNTVFYAIPSAETVARWRSETPSTFRFCPKIPRTISHVSRLDMGKNEILFFADRMRGLKERLGPMFLQLPPAFAPGHISQLQAFLDFWPTDLRLAVEVRHPEFFQEAHAVTLNNLLSQHRVARVMMDTRPIQVGSNEETRVLQARERKPNLPLQISITTDFTFVRYIGHPRMEVNIPFFNGWAEQMTEWLRQNITLYVFCHCPFEVHSPVLCSMFYERIRALAPLPPLPWQTDPPDRGPEQARLF